MGFISSIARSAIKLVKPLAQTAIKAIAPQAAGLLKNITGDIFSKGKDFLTKALSASGLPSPLKSLGQKLLGKGFEALQKLANGAIDKLLQKIVGSPAPRTTGDGVSVTPPAIQDRGGSLAANTPAAASTTSAATAASSSSAATASSAPASQGQATTSGFGWSGGAPSPVGRDMSDPNVAAKFQEEMMKYQQAMTNMQNFYQMMSAVFKSNADTTKNLIQNIR
jgi:hypothetical protein